MTKWTTATWDIEQGMVLLNTKNDQVALVLGEVSPGSERSVWVWILVGSWSKGVHRIRTTQIPVSVLALPYWVRLPEIKGRHYVTSCP